MLVGMDEYPFHQITDTFAAVAGSDPQWNDGHYVCFCDEAGEVCLTSNVGSTRTTTFSTASSACATTAASTTCGCRGGSGPISITSGWVRCASR